MNKPNEAQNQAVNELEAAAAAVTSVTKEAKKGAKLRLIESAANIVASYVGLNPVEPENIDALIVSVHGSLTRLLDSPEAAAQPGATDRPVPAVDPKASVFPDYIICLEDGKKLKMLKRHLKSSYGMTPAEYRERWQLPPEYPMTAPNYSAKRTAIAKNFGLGQKEQAEAEAEPAPKPTTARGRIKAAVEPAPAAPAKKPSRRSR